MTEGEKKKEQIYQYWVTFLQICLAKVFSKILKVECPRIAKTTWSNECLKRASSAVSSSAQIPATNSTLFLKTPVPKLPRTTFLTPCLSKRKRIRAILSFIAMYIPLSSSLFLSRRYRRTTPALTPALVTTSTSTGDCHSPLSSRMKSTWGE